jgi:hypothetical protein
MNRLRCLRVIFAIVARGSSCNSAQNLSMSVKPNLSVWVAGTHSNHRLHMNLMDLSVLALKFVVTSELQHAPS